MPELTILIGANGAGKTIWARGHRDRLPGRFYNPDSVADGIGDWNDRRTQREAGEFVARRIRTHLANRESFGLETTYAGRGRPQLVRRAKAFGYQVQAVFIGTDDPEVNVERVAARVRNRTGHSVAVDDIRRRWTAGQDNLRATFRSIDRTELWDNTGEAPRHLGYIDHGDRVALTEPLPAWARYLRPPRHQWPELRRPEAFSDEGPTAEEKRKLAPNEVETGRHSVTVGMRLARSCAGWGERRPTAAEFYEAVRTEGLTNRQRTILSVFAREATWRELVRGWAEEAYTLRELVAALHRADRTRCRASQYLNRWASAPPEDRQ